MRAGRRIWGMTASRVACCGQLLKMPIGYALGYVGYNNKLLPYIWVSVHTWAMRPDRLVSI